MAAAASAQGPQTHIVGEALHWDDAGIDLCNDLRCADEPIQPQGPIRPQVKMRAQLPLSEVLARGLHERAWAPRLIRQTMEQLVRRPARAPRQKTDVVPQGAR
eukprot:5115722-Pyramimonas_sp.AAC.1